LPKITSRRSNRSGASGFARVSGAAADIGSFEVQAGGSDIVFANGFDP